MLLWHSHIGEVLIGQHAKEWRYLAEMSRRVAVRYATKQTVSRFVNGLWWMPHSTKAWDYGPSRSVEANGCSASDGWMIMQVSA